MKRPPAWRIFAALLVAACGAGVALPAGSQEVQATPEESLRVGDPVGAAIRVGGKVLVLPPGRWQLALRSERPVSSDGSDNLGQMARLFLHEVVAGRLSRTLEIATTTSRTRVNWHDLPCKVQGDSYWLQDMAYGINSQFCVRVGFVSGISARTGPAEVQAWARSLTEQGVGLPREMPYVVVTRYTAGEFLRMRLSFDPAVSGIADSARAQRPFSDWQPASIRPGSAHERFYQALVDWAPAYAATVARVFERDAAVQPQAYGQPSLPQAR